MTPPSRVDKTPTPSLAETEAELRLRRLETAVRYLYTNSLPVPLIIIGFCFLLGQSQPMDALAVWGAITTAMWVCTTLTVRTFLRDERRGSRTTAWTVAICAVLFCACLALASVATFFWVDGDRLNNVLLYVLVAAGLAGAGSQSAPSTPVVITNMAPYVLVFLSLPLLHEAYPTNVAIAFLQVCYVVLVWLTANAVWQLSDEMLRLRGEKRLLIDQLQDSLVETRAAQLKAEAASRAKSEFLANMSHELRTPLNAVLGFSEIIKERTFGQDATGRYEEYAGHIHYSGKHLLGLIGDILDLSKIEAGKRELEETSFDLVAKAGEALRFVTPQTDRKKLTLRLDAPLRVGIFADDRAISQIMINLLSNAVKFTPDGGDITLSVFVDDAGVAVISVRDSGIGIDRDELEKVMERFGQARHDAITTPERGTGLGLPIVKGLVELHGGCVSIESELGSGTAVTVHLPPARVREISDDLATHAA